MFNYTLQSITTSLIYLMNVFPRSVQNTGFFTEDLDVIYIIGMLQQGIIESLNNEFYTHTQWVIHSLYWLSSFLFTGCDVMVTMFD